MKAGAGCLISVFSFAAIFAIMVLIAGPGCAKANIFQETRYCTISPKRNSDGTIFRRADVLREFKKIHPCPTTKLSKGPCNGYAIDHIIPLSVGGCDSVHNLQWLPNSIKSCANPMCKDRWERDVYRRLK